MNRSKFSLVAVCLIATMLLTFIVVSCHKDDQKKVALDHSEFTSEFVKEWYYGTFKKTKEWASHKSQYFGMKLPDWKNGKYQRAGSLEIMEYPLRKSNPSYLFPTPTGAVVTSAQIADASLARILFIKNSSGEIMVREVNYIPDAQYLQQSGFDISNNSITNMDKNFSGRLVVKKWNNKEVSRRLVQNGLFTKKGKIALVSRPGYTAASAPPTAQTDNCTTWEICEYSRECTWQLIGDNLEYICESWTPTGYCWQETYCESEDCPSGMSTEQCACMLFGCDPGSGDGPEDCDAKVEEFFNSGQTMNEKISVNVMGNNGSVRTKEYKWKVYGVSNGMIPMYLVGKEHSSQSTTGNNVWKYDSFNHIDISEVGTTILYGVSTSNVSATPTIYSSVIVNDYAKMYLSFTVKLSMICDGMPVVHSTSTNTDQTWHVSE